MRRVAREGLLWSRAVRCALPSLLAVGCALLAASEAAADSTDPALHPISVAVVGSAVSGLPVTLRVTGSNAPIPDLYNSAEQFELALFVQDATVFPSCQPTKPMEFRLGQLNPRYITLLAEFDPEGLATVGGPFSIDVTFTSGGPGPMVACAYTGSYLKGNLSKAADLAFTVAPAAGGSPPSSGPPPATGPPPASGQAPSSGQPSHGPAVVIVTAPASVRAARLRRGVPIGVTAAAGDTVAARLRVGSRTIATGSGTASRGGTLTITLKGSRSAIAKALGPARSRRATLRVTVTSRSSPARSATAHVTVQR